MIIIFPYNGLGWRFPEISTREIILCETFITLIYLNLGRISDDAVVQNINILSFQSTSFYCLLYKPSDLVSLLTITLTAFYIYAYIPYVW